MVDTLSVGILDVLTGRRGGLHLLGVGELREETGLKVLPALVLLAAVDEHFVLGRGGGHIHFGDMTTFIAVDLRQQQLCNFQRRSCCDFN